MVDAKNEGSHTKKSDQESPKANKLEKNIIETIKTILYAGVIALTVRTFAYEPFNIPSGSMIPTLLVGDYLFVSKFSYGYSALGTFYNLPSYSGRILGNNKPQRGDVVVFKLPSNPQIDYIKRIIGLPGDKIQVKDSILYINGQEAPREYIGEQIVDDSRGNAERYFLYTETLPNGIKHPILESDQGSILDDTEEYQVPADHYFMMGDNRDNSQDSRVLEKVGYVPYENLVGKAKYLFFSLAPRGTSFEIGRILNLPQDIRTERMLKSIK